jgi:hydrogenase/urease accessory protein HupE
VVLIGFGILAQAVFSHGHPVSVSYSEFSIGGGETRAVLRLPVEELDLLLQLDGDYDGQLSTNEIELSQGRVASYLNQRVRILDGDRQLPGTLVGMANWNDSQGYAFLEAELRYPVADLNLQDLKIQVDVFTELIPQHRNLAQILVGEERHDFVFEHASSFTASSLTEGFLETFASFLKLGVEHIFTGYDHVLFLLGVLLLGKSLVELVKIVTSFTVAHTLTLGLATFSVVEPRIWVIEASIALTIAYIGFENLVLKEIPWRWKITFLFGLIHGFGFANILREMNLPRSGLAASLFSFNLGVEMGQLVIVTLLYPLLLLAAGSRYRERITQCVSLVILGFGLVWFFQRIS